MTEWFEQWFGEEYLRLYRHRDDAEAEQVAELITRHVSVRDRWVLDLACGPGRHAGQFARRGATVVGFDLSLPLLSRARHRSEPPRALVRGDMRMLPFAGDRFDVVVNLFTSFGYFSSDAQHRLVLNEARRVLRQGGIFVLDYFNSALVRRDLVPVEERSVGRQRVVIERRITEDDRFVIKEIHLVDDGRRFLERVRLFTRDELRALLREAGLTVRHMFGDYDGSPAADGAPRVILMAERA